MTTFTTYDVKVYTHEDDRTTIKVSQDGDADSMLNVKASTDYYGKIDFSMDISTAEHLAKAILKQIEFIKGQQ